MFTNKDDNIQLLGAIRKCLVVTARDNNDKMIALIKQGSSKTCMKKKIEGYRTACDEANKDIRFIDAKIKEMTE